MNQMGKGKSPEEMELIKLEKFANPITGEKGKRISSKNMREVWISLQELMKETNANQTKFRKVKREWHLQSISELIEELQGNIKRQEARDDEQRRHPLGHPGED